MERKLILIALISIVSISALFSMFFIFITNNTGIKVTSFEECVKQPNSHILESYPERCITADGQSFTRILSDEERQNLIPPDEIPEKIPPTIDNTQAGQGCKISGCNAEICQNAEEEEMASICIYDEKLACYKTAKCEVQNNGNCAWTQTEELNNCLKKY